MGALESNTTLIYGIHIRESANDGSDFSNGAADYRVLFLGEDGSLKTKDSAGTVASAFTETLGATIVDAKGDLIAGTAADTVARLAVGTNGYKLKAASGESTGLQWVEDLATINFIIDGGGSAITTGVKGYIVVDFGCTIVSATTLLDQSGSIVVDIWKDTYANYPPVDADSITASAPPTVSSATKAQDTTLTGWTTSITAGDILGFNVDSATTTTRATVSLKARKT